MSVWRRARALAIRLAGVSSVRKNKANQNTFNDELEFHLQMQVDELVRSGIAPNMARREALLRSEGLEMTKQKYRERGTLPWIDDLLHDLRFAVRQLVKSPVFGVTVTFMLALGVGASIAIFAFVDAALLKPLPYPDPNRIAFVTESVKLFGYANLSYPDYLDWKRLNHSFSTFDVYGGGGGLLNTPSGALPVSSLRVTHSFFHTLGVAPILGREFYQGEDEPGGPKTVIASYGAWQKWFNGSTDVIGQKVTLDGISRTIVGVMPKSFVFARSGGTEFWMPYQAEGECDLRRSCHNLEGVARLKDGVSMQMAAEQMQTIAAQPRASIPWGQSRAGRVGTAAGRGRDIRPAADLIHAHERGWATVVDCLCERVKLIAGEVRGSHSRDRCSRCAGRKPGSIDETVSD